MLNAQEFDPDRFFSEDLDGRSKLDQFDLIFEKLTELGDEDVLSALKLLDSLSARVTQIELDFKRETIYQIRVVDLFMRSGDLSKAEEYVELLKTKLEENSNNVSEDPIMLEILIVVGEYEMESSNNSEAISWYNRARQEAESFNDSSQLLLAHHGLAMVYQSVGAFDLATQNSFLAVEIAENLGAREALVPTYNQLSVSLQELGDYDSAEDYLFKLKDLLEELGQESGNGYVYGNLSYNYLYRLDYEMALTYVEKAIPYFENAGYEAELCYAHSLIGRIYVNLGQLEKGDEYLDRSLEVALQEDYDEIIIEDYFGKSELAMAKGQYFRGEDYLNRTIEIAKKAQLNKFRFTALEMLVSLHEKSGDFEKALNSQKLKESLKDSLFAAQKNFQIAELQTQYETAKKDEAIVQGNLDLEKQRARTNTILIGLVLATLLVIAMVYFYLQIKKARNQLKAQNEVISEQNKELDTLNSTKDKFFSIIAHDLRSPMIALQGVGQKLEYFIKKNRQEKLLEMGTKIDQSIDQLNHLLNNLLSWAASQTGGIPHHPETFDPEELINENIDLYESLAMSKDLKIVHSDSSARVYADLNTTSTIIRNLLSNAIKFTEPGGTVKISVNRSGPTTQITIEDQGPGMDDSTAQSLFSSDLKSTSGSRGEKGFGLGLKLCKEFVAMNQGEIVVESEVGVGSKFIVSLPAQAASIERSIEVA